MRSYLIIIFISIIAIEADSQWETQNSGVSTSLWDVSFVDSLHGWAAGDSGVVIATIDGGKVWTKRFKFSDSIELKQVQFVNQNIGFVGGNVIKKFPTYEARQVLLLHTLDGGYDWERCDSTLEPNFTFGGLQFLNSEVGWLCINNIGSTTFNERKGVLVKTTNRGATWSILQEKNLLLTGTFVFVNNEQGYSFWSLSRDNYDDTDIDFTQDGGKTWNWVGKIKEEVVKKAKYVLPSTLWALGFKTSLSQDSGKTWESWNWFSPVIGGQKRFIPTDIEITSPQNFWLLGVALSSPSDIEGILFKTSDSGKSWLIDLQEPNYSFSALSIINNKKAWIAGTSGLIKYTADILTGVNKKDENLFDNFILAQNYPNPFNGTTAIEYYLPTSSSITFEINDILGRRIKAETKLNQGAGVHKVIWDGTDDKNQQVASGLFIYRITVNGKIWSKKMLLIR